VPRVEQTDVVIIGSGYGGSIPAARLAAAGMKVVVLERGPRYTKSDFRQSDDPRYIQTIVDVVVSSSNIAFRTGKLVGGASIPMDGAHFRMPQKSFGAKDAAGRPYWPDGFSRAALDPYYQKAETMLHVRQVAWNEISRAGGMFGKMLAAAGASCERARMNYADCVSCGFCAQGCKFDKKWNLPLTYIPMAETSGAEFRAGAEVDHIEPLGSTGGYAVYYQRDGMPQQIVGKRLFVAAGGIHTAGLLLRSKSYLPNLSAQVGKNFNNNGEHAFVGFLPPEFDDLTKYATYKGMDNAGLMSFHWYESNGFTLHPGGGFEPSIFAGSYAAANHPVLPTRSWGLELKRFVEKVYPHRLIGFSALGLADSHRSVVVGSDGKPDLKENDRTTYDAYLDRLESTVIQMGAQSGVTLVPAYPRSQAGMTSAHLLSACRMGTSADNGVVDANHQVFGYENLYICDASSVPYALGVNPALTISALAERCAEKVIAKG
jgi:choline dehydrogenase-like flavoprotein